MISIYNFLENATIPDNQRKYTPGDLTPHIVGVGAAIYDNKGRVLIQYLNKYGFWTLPCGKADDGEDAETGLKREIWEETGIKINKVKLINRKTFIYNRLGHKVINDTLVYDVISYSGTPKNLEPQKHKIQKFMTIDEILKLSDNISDILTIWLQGKKLL